MSYGYGSGKVLNGIDLSLIDPGLTCIIGPNGVGKSTMVKCIDRILKPDEGAVFVEGLDVRDYKLSELAKVVGFVPVSTGQSTSMNVLETVLMGRHPHQKFGSRSDDIRIAYEALKSVGMESYAMRDVSNLSAGQQQRVAVAKGIAQQPKLLILDEPTANLDIRHQILITKMLKGLAEGGDMGVLMISHDLNVASRFADTIIVMAPPGVVYAVGSPEDVITVEMVREVYGVESTIVTSHDRPHVILEDAVVFGDH